MWPIRLFRAIILAVLALTAMTSGAADRDPREVIEHFHARLAQLAAQLPADVERRVAALEPLIRETHDLAYIARFTLRRQWVDLSPAERATFVGAFTDLSVMTYATRFRAVTEDTFKIHEVRDAGRGRVQVEAAIQRPDAEPISLSYLLHENEGSWRIINIIADGVSDLALKRAEYQRVLEEQSFAGLIDHLGRLTGNLRNGAS